MRKSRWLSLVLFFSILLIFSFIAKAGQTKENTSKNAKWVIVISHPNSEVMWNALRYAIFLLKHNEEVGIFMQGPAVDYRRLHTKQFPVSDLIEDFIRNGGELKG